MDKPGIGMGRIAVIGIASNLTTIASVSRLEAMGMDVQVVSPEKAQKSLPDFAKQLTDGALLQVQDLQLEINSYTPLASGRQNRRERRAEKRKQNRV